MTDLAQNALAAKRVGQYLIDAGVLSAAQLDEALERQRRMSKAGFHVLLGTILEEMGAIDRQSLEAIILRQRLDEGSVNLGPEIDWSPFRPSSENENQASASSPESATDDSSELSVSHASEAMDAFFGEPGERSPSTNSWATPEPANAWTGGTQPTMPAPVFGLWDRERRTPSTESTIDTMSQEHNPLNSENEFTAISESSAPAPHAESASFVPLDASAFAGSPAPEAEVAATIEKEPAKSWRDDSLPRFPFFGRKRSESPSEEPTAEANRDEAAETSTDWMNESHAPTATETALEPAGFEAPGMSDFENSTSATADIDASLPSASVDDEPHSESEFVTEHYQSSSQATEEAEAEIESAHDGKSSVEAWAGETDVTSEELETVAQPASEVAMESEEPAPLGSWGSAPELQSPAAAAQTAAAQNTVAQVLRSSPESESAYPPLQDEVVPEEASSLENEAVADDAGSQAGSWSAGPVDLHGFKFSRSTAGLSQSEVSAVIGQLIRRTKTLEEQVDEAKETLSHLDSMRRYGEQSVKAADTIAQQIREEAEGQALAIRERAQLEARKIISEARGKHDEILQSAGAKAMEVSAEITREIEEHKSLNDAFQARAQALLDTDTSDVDEAD